MGCGASKHIAVTVAKPRIDSAIEANFILFEDFKNLRFTFEDSKQKTLIPLRVQKVLVTCNCSRNERWEFKGQPRNARNRPNPNYFGHRREGEGLEVISRSRKSVHTA